MRLQSISSKKLFGGIFVTLIAALALGGAHVYAAILNEVAPTNQNSTPTGGHVFMIRKAGGGGVQPDVMLSSYTRTDPSAGTFQLRPGTNNTSSVFVCDKKADSGTVRSEYISVTVSDHDGSPSQTAYIPYAGACDVNLNRTNVWGTNSNNVFYATYNIPNGTYNTHPDTGMYKVDIRVAYHTSVPQGTSSPDLVQQRFKVNMSDTSAKLGPFAQGNRAFPINGDWDVATSNPDSPTRIVIPFGRPCSAMTSITDARIGVYDADNGVFDYDVNFFVERLDPNTNNWIRVNLRNGVNGSVDSNDVYTPADRNANNADFQYAHIATFLPQTRYQMVIRGVMPRNTIDISIPGDTIYGAIDCRWNIQPTSVVTPTSQVPGGNVRYTHTSTNTGGFTSANVTSTVNWGKTGVRTAGTLGNDTRTYQANGLNGDSASWSNTFTIPSNATPGQVYCQYLRVNPRMSGETPTNRDSTNACVTVAANPPADRRVTISPSVTPGADIEPTQTTVLTGRVYVSGFPSDPSDWGYGQHSSQASPQSVAPTQSPYSSSNSYAGSVSPSRSGCARYNRFGTCVSWYWYCPNGTYMGTGSSAPGSCPTYRHYCQTYSWTDYNWSGTCYDRWYCPSPNWGVRYQQSQPNCNVYVCPYSSGYHSQSDPFYDTSPSPSDCEYRCNNGTGNVAHAGSPWSRTPCYQQPEFLLTCYWDNGPPITTATVRGNGEYCTSNATRTGSYIGELVCAEISNNYPTGWRGGSISGGNWGPYRDPGFRYDGTIERWGWTTPPQTASGCSRVVSKPTFKIDGGDVAVGGHFGAGCSNGPTSSIQAWSYSRSPNWQAARTQYAAYASGQIYGLATAGIRSNGMTQPPRSLAFANTVGGGEQFGGSFGSMPCVADHFGTRPASTGNMGSINNPSISGNGYFDMNAGQVNGQPKTVQRGSQLVLYYTGDLDINTNIYYQRNVAWNTPQDIPALKIIVRGNIRIDPSVTELNGIYVAEPDPSRAGPTGEIDTCAGVTAGNRFYGCNRKLTVNGAFIAKKVHLDRTNSSDPNSTAIFGGTAEQFNYLPEIWMAPWPRNDDNIEVKYDAITNLPPIL